jgi:hypothetical protein
MDSANLLLVVIAAADVFLSWRLVWPLLRAIRDAEGHDSADASRTSGPPSAPVAQALGELAAQGFARIGEVSTRLAGFGSLVSWQMADAGQTVMAEIVSGKRGAVVGFTTMLSDETVVTTRYRSGETFSTPRFVAAVCRTSLDDAYALHQRTVEAFRQVRSAAPRPIRSLADALEVDRIYRQRHFRRYLRPLLVRSLLAVIAMNIAAACAIAGFYLATESPSQSAPVAILLAIGICALIVMFVSYAEILRRAE